MVCKTPVRNCSLFSMAGCSSFVKNRSKASLGFSNAGRLARLNWAYDTHDHPPCSELAPASGMRSAKRMRFPKGSRMKNSLRPHGLASSADCTALVVKYCCCKTSTSLVSPGNEGWHPLGKKRKIFGETMCSLRRFIAAYLLDERYPPFRVASATGRKSNGYCSIWNDFRLGGLV